MRCSLLHVAHAGKLEHCFEDEMMTQELSNAGSTFCPLVKQQDLLVGEAHTGPAGVPAGSPFSL